VSSFDYKERTSTGKVAIGVDLVGELPRTVRATKAIGLTAAILRILGVYGNTYYVGVAGLSSILLASNKGSILLDGALPQSGFRNNGFPPVRSVRSVSDNETLRVGELAITAHLTPGHTPGSTTWTWRSCEADRCLDIVYADSLNAVSAPGFRFTADESKPSRVDGFTHSIASAESLPCDVLLTPHPEFFDMEAKLQRWREQRHVNPFIQSGSCKHAVQARRNLQRRIDEEHVAVGKRHGR
jgi:glyoxylase-like metal-dependent hydrolase (beta-lactamase superfamily II)